MKPIIRGPGSSQEANNDHLFSLTGQPSIRSRGCSEHKARSRISKWGRKQRCVRCRWGPVFPLLFHFICGETAAGEREVSRGLVRAVLGVVRIRCCLLMSLLHFQCSSVLDQTGLIYKESRWPQGAIRSNGENKRCEHEARHRKTEETFKLRLCVQFLQ